MAKFGNLTQTGSADPDGDNADNETEESAGSNPALAASTPTDVDGDSLPDAWDTVRFGDTTSQTGLADPDADGWTNAQEYTAATDPNDIADFLEIQSSGLTPDGAGFQLVVAGKSGRTYVLERSTALQPDGWTTLDTQGPLGADAPITFTDPAKPAPAAFYRVRVQLP